MLIHAVEGLEGLAPGKCGKGKAFGASAQPLFRILNQNSRLRTSVRLPAVGGR